jgi:3-hydroxyacyl-[acyl-carrier-protein] dehydratase
VKRAVFHELVRPGDQVRFEARIEQIQDAAAVTQGVIRRDGALIGEVELVFSHIDQNISGLEFPEENFVFTEEFMALLRTYTERDAQRIRL